MTGICYNFKIKIISLNKLIWAHLSITKKIYLKKLNNIMKKKKKIRHFYKLKNLKKQILLNKTN